MNRSPIAARAASRTGVGGSAVWDTVDAVFEAITEALTTGEDVRIAGLRTFDTRIRPALAGRSPVTGESQNIAAFTVSEFKAGKPLRDAVNAGVS